MTRLALALTLVLFGLSGCGVYGYAEPARPAYSYAPYSYGYYGYGTNSSGDYDWQDGTGSNYVGG